MNDWQPPIPRRTIRRLDDATIARIAAGEVVERPASVVKELVENAYDAGATRVDVRVEGGGVELIEVADDGVGIPPEELGLALERHATSKLTVPDPSDGVDTLGFRGEALASIASVSRFRLISRCRDSESAAGISVVGGSTAATFEVGRAPGTTAEVRDLFFETPARRKFLKAKAAEQVEILDLIEALYLAHPGIALSLTAEGKELLRLPASTRLKDAAGRVYGPEFLTASFGVDASLPGNTRLVAVLGRPERSRPNGAGLRIALNGRSIRSRTILQAVKLAYADHLPRARFPVGSVHLELPIDRVDVNVHPTKAEVRITRERELLDAVRHAVRSALQAGPAGEMTHAPIRLTPLGDVDTSARVDRILASLPNSLAVGPALLDDRGLTQTTLNVGNSEVGVPASGQRPALRLVGALFDLYWIGDAGEELWIIDQHAASERLLFDRLRSGGRIGRQELMEPVVVHLSARQRAVLAERSEELHTAGFEVEEFGPGADRIRAVPSYRGHTARPHALADLLEELAAGGRATVPDGGPDRLAASIACHAAVRAGDPIPPEAMRQILAGLDGLEEPGGRVPPRPPDRSTMVPFPARPILLAESPVRAPPRPRPHEHDLRAPVTEYLTGRGYRVWADPDGRDFLDIVAARETEVGLVELKVSDWKTVRAQGVARRSLADWVAVALPSEGAAQRLIDSARGPVAPRLGVWVVDGPEIRVLRAASALAEPPADSPAAEARSGFRALVRAAMDGGLPDSVHWGGQARRTGGGRSYRLDEFP